MGREVTPHTMSQNDKILKHLREEPFITQIEAAQRYGCYRLPARIDDLKKKGYPIKRKMCTRKNEEGHTVNYARYFLEQE